MAGTNAPPSSRIFVKGLPPTFTDAGFRAHFSHFDVTDCKIFPSRRIGYVGYRTPEEAQKAVQYFNKTFIRMSRIGVELARPPQEAKQAPVASRASPTYETISGGLKRKRDALDGKEQPDPKLEEFLDAMKPKNKRRAWESGASEIAMADEPTQPIVEGGQSDEEYEDVPELARRVHRPDAREPEVVLKAGDENPLPATNLEIVKASVDSTATKDNTLRDEAVTDSYWARSRTSRLLGLLDEDEEESTTVKSRQADADAGFAGSLDNFTKHARRAATSELEDATAHLVPTTAVEVGEDQLDGQPEPSLVRTSMRLFVRNLPYDLKDEDLEAEFEPFGNLEEVHISLDKKSGQCKGFAFVQFSNPDSAERALLEKDGQTFQGRLFHIIPATVKHETKLDDFALSKLPLKKQQQIKRKREAASSTFNWNALYMNADAVVSSVADRLGLSKSEVLDPTSSEAAVKQAHAETHVIQDTKAYFKKQGIDLDAFKRKQRGDTAILVKNIPYDVSKDELSRMFKEHGDVKRFLMPPSGTIAIVEFASAAQCKTAYGACAYRRVKNSMLFLEKAPKDLFTIDQVAKDDDVAGNGIATVTKTSVSDLKDSDFATTEMGGTSTLFVRNLNFSTTTSLLTETLKPLDGFMSARVKTKTDPKRPGEILSMGFGFLEFRTSKQARAALMAMDGYNLEGHKLQIRASHKGADAAEERRKDDAAKKVAGKKTKVIIKNLPFEATKKDVRALFGAYGQLRSVRVPKKMDRAARGFAFADFTTPKEAESAMDALRDTHLLGRRLVLDFATGDAEDAEAEIERMQQKVGEQINKVALQKLTSAGRKKFSTTNDEETGNS